MNKSHGTLHRHHSNIFCNCAECHSFDYAETAPIRRRATLPYPDATILVPELLPAQAHPQDRYWTYDDTPDQLPTMPLESAGETVPMPSLTPILNTVQVVTTWINPATGARIPVYWPVHQ
jgi:hypothetical protein